MNVMKQFKINLGQKVHLLPSSYTLYRLVNPINFTNYDLMHCIKQIFLLKKCYYKMIIQLRQSFINNLRGCHFVSINISYLLGK